MTSGRFGGVYKGDMIDTWHHGVRFKDFKDLHRHLRVIEVARQKLLLVWLYSTVGAAICCIGQCNRAT